MKCARCMYWSDLIARKPEGAMHIEALCLKAGGAKGGQYTTERDVCPSFRAGHPVDAPKTTPLRYT